MHLIDWLQEHLLTCPSKKWLHMECPGCGMQRSFIELLRGHLDQSLHLHPATIPMLLLLLFAPAHIIFKLPKGATVIIILQAIVAILSLTFYVYKIIHHQIFF